MDPIETVAAHVAAASFARLPDGAVAAAKTFILDTLGVGVLGSSGPRTAEIASALAPAGAVGEARVWGTGRRLPAAAAALVNATQAHNAEFDCVHEAAVVHAMTIVLPVALAGAERSGAVDGRRLIEAVVAGVDVAASLGLAATSGLRFFRPATAGAFGGVAALGRLLGFDQARLVHAFSIAYAQVSGTMQAHAEGSMLLPVQMGFNARNAVTACDLARCGVEGPVNVLEGPFGYFRLIEAGGEPATVLADLGRTWRISELAHKPFPSGRATHGIIDACLALRAGHTIAPERIAGVRAAVPPLVGRLVGRPFRDDMSINYARLCAAYLAARALLRGEVDASDYAEAAYRDPATVRLARRVAIEPQDLADPNALTPVTVEIVLVDGSRHAATIEVVTGNPAKPLERAAHLAKLRRAMRSGARAISDAAVERLIAAVDHLEECADVARLVDLLVPDSC